MISNRRSQLQGEIDDARSRLAQRRSQMEALDVRRREIMNLLSSYGALDQYTKLQSELSRLQAEVLELRKRLELAVQVEEKKTELTIERARIQQELFGIFATMIRRSRKRSSFSRICRDESQTTKAAFKSVQPKMARRLRSWSRVAVVSGFETCRFYASI